MRPPHRSLAPLLALCLLGSVIAACNRRSGASGGERLPPKRSAVELGKSLTAATYTSRGEELRGDITVSGGDFNRVKLNGILRVRPDTALWFTLRKFGIEGARGILTADSAIVLNRLNREVLRASAADLPPEARLLPVEPNLANLIAALYGHPVGELTGGKVEREPGGYRVALHGGQSTFSVSADGNHLDRWTYNDGKRYGRADYSDFRKVGETGQELPYRRNLAFSQEPGDTTRLFFELESVTEQAELRFPISVPPDYAPMSF